MIWVGILGLVLFAIFMIGYFVQTSIEYGLLTDLAGQVRAIEKSLNEEGEFSFQKGLKLRVSDLESKVRILEDEIKRRNIAWKLPAEKGND